MGKKLALPEKAGEDIKTITGILDKWATGAEDVMKDTFGWAKKHKLLVLFFVGCVALYRYWLSEGEE